MGPHGTSENDPKDVLDDDVARGEGGGGGYVNVQRRPGWIKLQ